MAPLDWPCALPLRVCSTLLVERSTPWPGQYSSSSESGPLFSAESVPHVATLGSLYFIYKLSKVHVCTEAQSLLLALRPLLAGLTL